MGRKRIALNGELSFQKPLGDQYRLPRGAVHRNTAASLHNFGTGPPDWRIGIYGRLSNSPGYVIEDRVKPSEGGTAGFGRRVNAAAARCADPATRQCAAKNVTFNLCTPHAPRDITTTFVSA